MTRAPTRRRQSPAFADSRSPAKRSRRRPARRRGGAAGAASSPRRGARERGGPPPRSAAPFRAADRTSDPARGGRRRAGGAGARAGVALAARVRRATESVPARRGTPTRRARRRTVHAARARAKNGVRDAAGSSLALPRVPRQRRAAPWAVELPGRGRTRARVRRGSSTTARARSGGARLLGSNPRRRASAEQRGATGVWRARGAPPDSAAPRRAELRLQLVIAASRLPPPTPRGAPSTRPNAARLGGGTARRGTSRRASGASAGGRDGGGALQSFEPHAGERDPCRGRWRAIGGGHDGRRKPPRGTRRAQAARRRHRG